MIITGLKNAKETLNDGLLVPLVLKGVPEAFKAFSAHVTQSESEIKFTELKTKLQSFKDTQEMCMMEQEDTDHKLLTDITDLRAVCLQHSVKLKTLSKR